jgi:hypothetical protein
MMAGITANPTKPITTVHIHDADCGKKNTD